MIESSFQLQPHLVRLGALCSRLGEDRSGATAVEYAVVASCMALTILAGIVALGTGLQGHWERLAAIINPNLH